MLQLMRMANHQVDKAISMQGQEEVSHTKHMGASYFSEHSRSELGFTRWSQEAFVQA